MKRLLLALLSVSLLYSCSADTGTFSSTRNGGADAKADLDYLLKLEAFPVVIEYEKVDLKMETIIRIPVTIKELKETDFLVTNGKITSITKLNDRDYAVVVNPLTYGDVTLQLPAKSVDASHADKQNTASNVAITNFEEHEIDNSIVSIEVDIERVNNSDLTKLVLIVDDSSSMADDHQRLGDALRKSLITFKDKNLEVFAYSTTNFSLKSSITQGVLYSGEGHTANFTNYAGSYAAEGGYGRVRGLFYGSNYIASQSSSTRNNTKHLAISKVVRFIRNGNIFQWQPDMYFDHDRIEEDFVIAPSAFGTEGSIKLNPQMSDSDFEAAVDTIVDNIKDFGDEGSVNEFPLCTLLNLVQNDGPNAIFSTDKKDKVNFVILSDEDQSQHKCLDGYESNITKKEVVTAYPQFKYKRYTLPVEVLGDGSTNTYVDYSTSGLLYHDNTCIVNGADTCTNTTSTCSTAEITSVTNHVKAWIAGQTPGRYRIKPGATCRRQSLSTSINFPTAYRTLPIVGIQVSTDVRCSTTNFDYTQDSVQKNSGQQSLLQIMTSINDSQMSIGTKCFLTDFYTETGRKFLDPVGYEEVGEDLNKLIKLKADQLFGIANYSISAITNLGDANPQGCENSKDNVATKIREISNIEQSICDDNFNVTFDWLNNFVRFKASDSYDLNDKSVLTIHSVKLPYLDEYLLPSQYTLEDGALKITDSSVLKLNDGKIIIRYREIE